MTDFQRLSRISTEWSKLFQAHAGEKDAAVEARQEMLGLWSLVAPRYLTISVRGMGFRFFKWIPILSNSPLVVIETTAKLMVSRLKLAAHGSEDPEDSMVIESE